MHVAPRGRLAEVRSDGRCRALVAHRMAHSDRPAHSLRGQQRLGAANAVETGRGAVLRGSLGALLRDQSLLDIFNVAFNILQQLQVRRCTRNTPNAQP